MCTGTSFDSPASALRAAGAALDYLNAATGTVFDVPACGETLIVLGEIQAKLTAAHAEPCAALTLLTRTTRTGTGPPRPG